MPPTDAVGVPARRLADLRALRGDPMMAVPDGFRQLDADGRTADELAQTYGVSTKTVQRWRARTRPVYLSRGSGYRMSGRTP